MSELTALLITTFTVTSVLWLSRLKVGWIQKLLDWFPAILFSYVIPAAFTHAFNLNLSEVYLHTLSRNWVIPLAILTVMSSLSFHKLKQVGVKPIILFATGSFSIAVLAPVFVSAFIFVWPSSREIFIDQGYWRGLIPIVGSWIGGSTSQLVLKELVVCPESLFLSVIVLDNVLINSWTILMFQSIKRSDALNTFLKIAPQELQPAYKTSRSEGDPIHSTRLTSGLILVGTFIIISSTDNFLLRISLLSVAGLALGNVIPRWSHSFVLKAGGILIIIIMSILGLRLDFNNLSLPMAFVALCIVWIVGHYVVMLLMAKILNVHMAWVPIASMANVGGISTAPAVASAYHKDWMPHAILLAILSMVSSNLWGVFSIFLFNLFNL
ncbi:MAG: DUF819 family protein [Bacteroidia bacterium]|nr:DUF819 family protein [Bacteroidia bacterium]